MNVADAKHASNSSLLKLFCSLQVPGVGLAWRGFFSDCPAIVYNSHFRQRSHSLFYVQIGAVLTGFYLIFQRMTFSVFDLIAFYESSYNRSYRLIALVPLRYVDFVENFGCWSLCLLLLVALSNPPALSNFVVCGVQLKTGWLGLVSGLSYCWAHTK